MQDDKKFDYDVAISFVAADETIAMRIAGLLSDRFKVFIYSEQQKQLAGRDGEEAFASVFAQKSRIVVIFYREQWGKTPWTRIEETAIRGRAHDEGYGFTLWVPLDKEMKLPPWLPKTRLWFNFERFGDSGLQAVIEQLIQEQGGNTKPETLAERAERMKREVKLGEARIKLVEGYDMEAGRKVAAMAKEVSDRVACWVESGDLPGCVLRRHGSHTLLLSFDRTPKAPACLFLQWTQPYTNHVGPNARLLVTIYEGTPNFPGIWVIDEPTLIEQFGFAPDLDSGFEVCWKENGVGSELSADITSEVIARRFMDAITRISTPKR